jgi:hypothetical protein
VESVGEYLHRHGWRIGEIDKANERVRDLAKQGEDAGTEASSRPGSTWPTA